jgi:voltage-gated potassium channel
MTIKYIKSSIRNIIDNTDTVPGKVFGYIIHFIILISIITFSIETIPNISPYIKNCLNIIEIVTIIIFTFEYILRVLVTEKKIKFIFSFYGLIDLLAILPFYISCGIDLRTLRIFRLLRLLRILKLFKYNKTIKLFQKAFIIAKDELILFSIMAIITLFLSSVGIYHFEHVVQPEQFKSVFHSFWWTIITLTTVGYGDMVPITIGGKIFTSIILIIGLGIVAIPTGLITSALIQSRDETKD